MSTRDESKGRLSVVATPIGNLEDMTLRGLATLKAADRILAEDTRHTRTLCERHGIRTPLKSFHAHTDDSVVGTLIEELRAGAHLALVSDAGTPLVSDPGVRLVAAARDAGIFVETIPGASAVTAAVAVCGLRCDTFRFLGFLPRSGGKRRRLLEDMAIDRSATVIFESPKRLAKTLFELQTHAGEGRRAAVCRELTKLHEEVVRGTLGELSERFALGARGEITLVLEGATSDAAAEIPDDEVLDERIRTALLSGQSARDVARELSAEAGLARREAYRRVLAVAEAQEGEAEEPDEG